MKDAKGHGSDSRGGGYPSLSDIRKVDPNYGAHSAGINQVGKTPMRPPLPPESAASRNLRLFADNDANLNRQSMQPVRDNLGKKMDKGVYDPDKAVTLFKYHADRAAQAYAKAGGATGESNAPWHQQFPPAVRAEAAQHWEADERDDIKSGSSRTYKG
jgi:hypothetical protein